MSEKRRNILMVGMVDSVHLARWISQFSDQDIDFTIFPSSPHRRIHPILRELMSSTTNGMTVSLKPASMRWLALPLSALDIPFKNFFRSHLLRRLIESNSFDLIHILELQHAGYLLLDTQLDAILPKVLITNWGSDIFWFEQFPKHRAKIIRLLQIASFYSAECQRDIEIVRRLGYMGITMPVIPNSGGINLDKIQKNTLPPSQRKKIIIKGYTGFVGQALVALKACEAAAIYLRGYEVVLYSASFKARLRALVLRHIQKIKVTIVEKRTPHSKMLEHFSHSRIYIGISLSDGISTSLLEAMATGCYPIQTNTSCANEWIEDLAGSIVEPSAIHELCEVVKGALANDALVDNAAVINFAKIQKNADHRQIATKASKFYNNLTNSPIVL